MTIEHYTAAIDTAILALLVAWALLDRFQIYFERPKGERPGALCTGLTARWCPIHGDCKCPQDGDLDACDCPLHHFGSEHGEARP